MKMHLTRQEQQFLFKTMPTERVNQLLTANDFNAVLLIQEFLNDKHGYNLREDGIWGPVTEHSLYTVAVGGTKSKNVSRPTSVTITKRSGKKIGGIIVPNRPSWTNKLPTTGAASMNRYYGRPGTNLVRMTFPYKMYYAGKRVKTTRVNKKCLPWFMGVFEDLKKEYDQATLDRLKLSVYSGLVNIRPIRGGKIPSAHSWGGVIDMAAGSNRMHQNHKTALFAKSKYQKFWDIVYANGGVSLGLSADFDYMHWGFHR